MPGPNVTINRDLFNDYIYKALALIDTTAPKIEDLEQARRILLELSQYVTQAPLKEGNIRPSIKVR